MVISTFIFSLPNISVAPVWFISDLLIVNAEDKSLVVTDRFLILVFLTSPLVLEPPNTLIIFAPPKLTLVVVAPASLPPP